MSTVQRVKFLWDASMALKPTATHLDNLLKSHLRNTCRALAATNTNIPLERFSESQMCNRCSLHWQENDFHIKYKPQGLQITGNKTKKLLKRLNDQEAGKVQKQLTRKQKMRAKWLLKKSKHMLEIHCEFCKKKTCVALEKPAQPRKIKQVAAVKAQNPQADKTKKKTKKNKPKNKTAGLKIPTKNLKSTPVDLNLNSKDLTLTKKEPMKADKLQMEPINKGGPIKPNKCQTKPLPKNKTKGTPANPTPKAQTKTQKQNALLQLAALLKKQDNTSSNQNRLQSLLK